MCRTCAQEFRRIPRFGFTNRAVRICNRCSKPIREWEFDTLVQLVTTASQLHLIRELTSVTNPERWSEVANNIQADLKLECLAQAPANSFAPEQWANLISQLYSSCSSNASNWVLSVVVDYPDAAQWIKVARLTKSGASSVYTALQLNADSIIDELVYWSASKAYYQDSDIVNVVQTLLLKIRKESNNAQRYCSRINELSQSPEMQLQVLHCCKADGLTWVQYWKTIVIPEWDKYPGIKDLWLQYLPSFSVLPPAVELAKVGVPELAILVLCNNAKPNADYWVEQGLNLISANQASCALYCFSKLLSLNLPENKIQHAIGEQIGVMIGADIQVSDVHQSLIIMTKWFLETKQYHTANATLWLSLISRNDYNSLSSEVRRFEMAWLWMELAPELKNPVAQVYCGMQAINCCPTPSFVLSFANFLANSDPATSLNLLQVLWRCEIIGQLSPMDQVLFHFTIADIAARMNHPVLVQKAALQSGLSLLTKDQISDFVEYNKRYEEIIGWVNSQIEEVQTEILGLFSFARNGHTAVVVDKLLSWWKDNNKTALGLCVQHFSQLGKDHSLYQFVCLLADELSTGKLDKTTTLKLSGVACGESVRKGIAVILASPRIRSGTLKELAEGIQLVLSDNDSIWDNEALTLKLAQLSPVTKYQHFFKPTGELRALALSERAIIRAGSNFSGADLALRYLNLVDAAAEVSSLSVCGCFLHAAVAFLRILPQSDLPESFGYKKALMECLWTVLALSARLGLAEREYTARFALSILLRVFALKSRVSERFLEQRDGQLLLLCLERLARSAAILPILPVPITHACDLIYMQSISANFAQSSLKTSHLMIRL